MVQPTSNYVLLEDIGLSKMKDFEVSRILAVGPYVNYLNNGDLGPEIVKEGGKAIYAKDSYETIIIDNISYRVIEAYQICAVVN